MHTLSSIFIGSYVPRIYVAKETPFLLAVHTFNAINNSTEHTYSGVCAAMVAAVSGRQSIGFSEARRQGGLNCTLHSCTHLQERCAPDLGLVVSRAAFAASGARCPGMHIPWACRTAARPSRDHPAPKHRPLDDGCILDTPFRDPSGMLCAVRRFVFRQIQVHREHPC